MMNRKPALVRILAFILAMLLLFTSIGGGVLHASAASAEDEFKSSDVLDDLVGATVGGKAFDMLDYPYDPAGSLRVISFTEYCYSYAANKQDDYGLYLYIYNPAGRAVDTASQQHKIQMAVSYDSSGNITRYEKFRLEFCSASAGNYKDLFYKFRVVDREINGSTFADRVNSHQRRYDVSGIELHLAGNRNATDYRVGGTYYFSGYAAGYGPDADAESTLTGTVKEMETVSLEVHHSNYRSNLSSLGENHYNEVNTVYFSVPERIYEQYGRLQKIHAEWWEYKTKMAAITSNLDFYAELLAYVGTDVGEYDPDVPVFLYAEYEGSTTATTTHHHYGWAFNKDMSRKTTFLGTTYCTYDKMSTIMPYAFYAPVVDAGSVFDFLYSEPPAGSVEANVVQDWIYNYSNNLGNGYIACNGRKISKDLFEEYVDDGRKMGYNNVSVDLSDTFDLNSYDSNHSWWDKLWAFGFSWPATSGDYKDVLPIYELKSKDLSGSDDAIAERLLINQNDVSDLKAFYTVQAGKGNRVILFRFANTDYYAAPAFRSGYSGSINDTDTYVAQQTVFLDFDIIDLTFNKDGVYTVIPVVASPTDVIKDFDPPAEEFEWWKIVLSILMIALLIVVLVPTMPYIVQFVMWAFVTPIQKLIRWIKSKRR